MPAKPKKPFSKKNIISSPKAVSKNSIPAVVQESPPVENSLQTAKTHGTEASVSASGKPVLPVDGVTVPASPEPSLEEALESEPEDTSKIRSNIFLYRIGIIVAVSIIVVTALVVVVALGVRKGDEGKEVVVTAPSPTPAPVAPKSSVTFEVRNATGITGSAAKAGSKLTQAGYTVVALGNSPKQKGSKLYLSAALAPATVAEIHKDTQSLFSVASSSGDISGKSGDISGKSGDISGKSGDISGKSGDISGSGVSTSSTASALLILGN